MTAPLLILASASPRRYELLTQIGVSCRVETADVDESPLADETPEALVSRLAQQKAQAVWQRLAATPDGLFLPVLGADTLGVLDGELLLKPRDFVDAQALLGRMSGRWHTIFTAVALVTAAGTSVVLNRNAVKFRSVSDAEILAYWRTGESCDKAGAYAIQGRGAVFVERLEGSYSGVMGLPLFETAQLLAAAGIKTM
ncbi:Maf family protein [Candidatus Thiothrix anitrata]|jgi:septum formation protein|uniref:dTTP/UTP pyrophosphatase n=1 Tax=Candidatus Thiothrix anitrata TaxID=2823902 RepID=A0ABX7X3I5_9GAMM|nr:Maf family protein [Candidatus Thiothrix anitrata]QTR49348.1 septum formation inhibitor Maf [Candidatus Thiothrix anitrata]